MSKFREQLIKIQKENYRKNIKHLRDTLAHNPIVEKYENEYHKHLKTYDNISNKSELLKKILSSDIVYHGDYHTLRQSQRCILRVLRDISGKRDIVLCMEMLHSIDQKYMDAFLKNKITEHTFLNKINYHKKWPFSWRNFRPIVIFCKENHIPIIGINTHLGDGPKRLSNRDKHAARIIAKASIRYPDKLVYVFDGDFHISPNHLPKEVDKLLDILDHPAKTLIVYQNAAKLYWMLCKEGKEESDVLKVSENSYCIMNTMPANKVQSYLSWLEYSEDAYYPVHWEWEDDSYGGEGITVQEMIKTISSILQLPLPENRLDNLTIYYANNFYLIDILNDIDGIKGKIKLIKEKIKREEGFLLEYEQRNTTKYIIYLANSNSNMAAEEAAHFVNAASRGPLGERLNAFDQFYRNAVTECLGFFGSKFINEKRKSHSEYSIRKFLGQMRRGEEIQIAPEIPLIARYMLQHFYLQRKTSDPREYLKKFYEAFNHPGEVPYIFSTQLGYILGNKLYYAVKRGEFPIRKIREYFRDPFDTPEKAFRCYIDISNEMKKIKSVSRF